MPAFCQRLGWLAVQLVAGHQFAAEFGSYGLARPSQRISWPREQVFGSADGV
ncbi:MAG: hypothetical protein LBI49_16845 [Nocardiopsaceae bacterium]|jgi:hypothetical protein|nr:hypothetical protein [Nocardiopsaceae bacterium]